jgi:hypothetical protein
MTRCQLEYLLKESTKSVLCIFKAVRNPWKKKKKKEGSSKVEGSCSLDYWILGQ